MLRRALHVTAVVELLVGALVEAFCIAAGDGSSLSGKEWWGPWSPCQDVPYGTVKRHVSRCCNLAVRSVTAVLGGDCSWMWAALGHLMGLWSPKPRLTRAREMRLIQSPPTREANSGRGTALRGRFHLRR